MRKANWGAKAHREDHNDGVEANRVISIPRFGIAISPKAKQRDARRSLIKIKLVQGAAVCVSNREFRPQS
jgi:hypothetical protein